ncbi:MAG: ROK family protein [Propionibacteriaceae bacterium]|jgi:polyphosphate glucokinase|nr:ROK family protein [Propionibacteriaceae bacterium]
MVAQAFGIDIGGSGIKGAPVNLETGELATERVRIPTPQPSTPKAVAKTVAKLLDEFGDQAKDMPIGITVPCPVINGITPAMANLDKQWIGCAAADVMTSVVGRPITLLNDADAAGLAEVYFGAAKGHKGLVIVTTLGTGIGSALIYGGVLIPNSELGHLEIDGFDAEKRAAASIRTNEDLSWKAYIKRLQRYYETLDFLFSPDMFVVGGGISRDADKFLPFLKLNASIVPAQLRNQAGIVGAAWYAHQAQASSPTRSPQG